MAEQLLTDALGPAHYRRTGRGSLQIPALLLIENGEEGGASLLFMWIKTLSHWDRLQCADSKLLTRWNLTLPVPPPPPTALAEAENILVAVLVATTPFDLQFSGMVVPGCPLGRPMPGWFL